MFQLAFYNLCGDGRSCPAFDAAEVTVAFQSTVQASCVALVNEIGVSVRQWILDCLVQRILGFLRHFDMISAGDTGRWDVFVN